MHVIIKRCLCGVLFFEATACQTKMVDNTAEGEEIAQLKSNNSLLQDSIRALAMRVNHLEQSNSNTITANRTAANTKLSPKENSSVRTAAINSPKPLALLDTIHVSSNAIVLSNTCRWYFKYVEEVKDSSSKKLKECNFHGAKDIVYINERQVSLDEMKRTRDYEFDVASKISTYCPNIILVLECR